MSEQKKLDAERAAFDAWVIPAWSLETQIDGDGDTVYVEDWVQGAWIAWQKARSLPVGVPDGYMPIPTAEQLADALSNVRCFHDLSAELIAPELLANLLAAIAGQDASVANSAIPNYQDARVAQSAGEAGKREAVEVVGWQDAENPLYTTAERRVMHEWVANQYPIVELMTVAQHERIVAALSAQQSAPVTEEPSPLDVIGYASPGQIEILRELPRTGGMKVKGRKDDCYSEPVVLLSDARAAMISLAARCQQEGAFKACLECGYQDGHDEICQFHASNRNQQQSAHVSVPRELLERVATHLEWDGDESQTVIQYANKCDALAAELFTLLDGCEV